MVADFLTGSDDGVHRPTHALSAAADDRTHRALDGDGAGPDHKTQPGRPRSFFGLQRGRRTPGCLAGVCHRYTIKPFCSDFPRLLLRSVKWGCFVVTFNRRYCTCDAYEHSLVKSPVPEVRQASWGPLLYFSCVSPLSLQLFAMAQTSQPRLEQPKQYR